MGDVLNKARVVYRDFHPNAASGVPYEPSKAEIRDDLFGLVDNKLVDLQAQVLAVSLEADSITQATWAGLSAITGTRLGQSGIVTTGAGTHTDPVVGGTVADKGMFAWSVSPAGWQRVSDLLITASESTSLQASSVLNAERAEVNSTAARRGWPQIPVEGTVASAERSSALMTYARSGTATRRNSYGLTETVAADALIHSYDVDGRYTGLRFQPAKTPDGLWSEDFTQSYWTKNRMTVTAEYASGPNARGTADRLLETTDSGTHNVGRLSGIPDLASGGKMWAEWMVRDVGGRTLVVPSIDGSGGVYSAQTVGVDLSTSTIWRAKTADLSHVLVERVTSGPYAGFTRIVVQLTASVAVTSVRLYLSLYQSSSVFSYVGETTKGIDVAYFGWGAGGYVPGYVQTVGTVTARGAPLFQSGSETLPEGTLYCQFKVNSVPVPGAIQRVASFHPATTDRVHITVSAADTLYAGMLLNSGGLILPVDGQQPAMVVGQVYRAAVSWKAGRQVFALDGTVYVPPTHLTSGLVGSGTLVAARQSGSDASNPADVDITEIAVFPRSMTDAELQSLTSFTPVSVGTGGYTVDRSYVEINSDLSTDTILTWHAASSSPKAVEYRVAGASSWMSAGAMMRDFPSATEKVFSAQIENLTPNTIYEWRPANSGDSNIKKFRTVPKYRERDLKFAVVSDWQQNSANAVSPTSKFNILNDFVASGVPDFVLLLGDFVNDNGGADSTKTQAWRDFISAWSTRFVDADGCMIPILAIAGNHEAGDGSPGGGSFTGDQPYGYMSSLLTSVYRSAPNVGGQGYGYFTIGTELLAVCLETNHGTPLDSTQINWFSALLAAEAAKYRHVVVFGHFSPGSYANSHWTSLAAGKILRERVFPIIQDYPNIKFYMHGHNHALNATRKVKWTANASPTGTNLWYEDAAGFRCLGAGGWDSPATTDFDVQDQASTIDSSVLLEYIVATNQSARGVTPTSTPNNTSDDPATRHFWRCTLKAAEIEAKAISLSGTTLLALTENL